MDNAGEPRRKGRHPPLPEGALLGDVWELDVVRLDLELRGQPSARPVMITLVSDPYALFIRLEAEPPAEIDRLAELLVEDTLSTIDARGVVPEELRVAFPELVEPVAAGLAHLGVQVRAVDCLLAVTGLLEDMGTPEFQPARLDEAQGAVTWGAWGLPEEIVADIFAAAQDFHDHAPWRIARHYQPIEVTDASGRRWEARVLGPQLMDDSFGLLLSAWPGTHWATIDDAETPLPALGLILERGRDLTRAGRREIRRTGWPKAGRGRYPILRVRGTPGMGVTPEQAQLLAAVLAACGPFVKGHQAAFTGSPGSTLPVAETFEAEGLSLVYRGLDCQPKSLLWGAPWRLTPGLAVGPGASPPPTDRLDEGLGDEALAAEYQRVQAFANHLARSRLSGATIDRHATNVSMYLDHCARARSTPLAATTEHHLRTFLYGTRPLMPRPRTTAVATPVSLRRFFDFVAATEGLEFPWAEEILQDRDSFVWCLDMASHLEWRNDVPATAEVVAQDLDGRGLQVSDRIALGPPWLALAGTEHDWLLREIEARWLTWRAEAIEAGVTDPDLLLTNVGRRLAEWGNKVHPRLGRRTPAAVAAAAEAAEEARLRALTENVVRAARAAARQ
ncbi:MAG: hypothetical protein ACE5EL_00570 [Anaerolineae bacterium]